ncbi:TPA: ABC transporter permease, partial [Streptococcus suis]
DDRNGLDKRIYLSGVSNFSYVLQQVLFNSLILFTTNLLSSLILLPLFDLDISWKLVLYILLIELFSANFGMVLSTLTKKKSRGAINRNNGICSDYASFGCIIFCKKRFYTR